MKTFEDVWKTSFVFGFRRRPSRRLSYSASEDVLKTSSRRLDQDEYICLSHMSSRRLQDVFKTSSRHLQDVLPRCLQDIFKMLSRNLAKTSSRHLEDVLQRYLQDVFKTYHQAKLFLLTRPKGVFETYSTCF